jgi:RimJ/RimL family protein N-acetyltransferase
MTTIEPLSPDNFELVAGWLARPEINKWLTGEWRERPATPAIIAIATRNRRNRMFLVREDGVPCGLVGLADIDLADKIAMVWYLLGEDQFKGRGITSEALRHLARLGFAELSLESIYAWIMENNAGSRRVLEKAGFKECGRIRNSANFEKQQLSRIYFDLTRDEVLP